MQATVFNIHAGSELGRMLGVKYEAVPMKCPGTRALGGPRVGQGGNQGERRAARSLPR